jgi:ATP-binding protein involved in chromosome partitioning
MTDTEDIAAALRTVTDPDLGDDVVSAGLVTDVTVDDGVVTLSVELAGLAPETAEDIVEQMRSVVLGLAGVEQVRVDGEEPGTDAEMADVGIGTDRIVAVASAKGGVGKSTVATSLARGLAERGEDVGIFDADIHGPNVPQLLDAEGPVVATDDGHAAPVDAAGLSVMSIGLLDNDAPIAWRGAMAHEALLDLLTDTAWDDLDTLVVDLPPGTGDIVLTTLQDVPVDGVVLVTTPYPTAVDDTGRSATLFRENGVPILGAVVNMAGFTCPTCGDDHDLFGHDDIDLDVPILADLPFDDSMRNPTTALPEKITSLAASVDESLADAGFDVPESALDVSGLPAGIRLELVTDEFAALDPGEDLTVVTDQHPDSLLAALGADGPSSHWGDTEKPHEGCQCDHNHSHEGMEPDAETDHGPVEDVEVNQLGPEEWAFRVWKGVERDYPSECAADA